LPGRFSPATAERGRRTDESLDRARAEAGNDRNHDAADQQVPDSHGDKSLNLPGTSNRRVAGR
jgi:hypothetical protein